MLCIVRKNLVHLAICKLCRGSVLDNCRRLSNSSCFALRKTVALYKVGGMLSPNVINFFASLLRHTLALLCPSNNSSAIFLHKYLFNALFLLCASSVEKPKRVHSNVISRFHRLIIQCAY